MQPKKKKPQHKPQPKPKAVKHAARVESPMTDTEAAEQPIVNQSMSTQAGPYAHIDPEAQADAQKQLNLHVTRETRIPFKPPEVPPGMSPNQLIAHVVSGGLVAPPQTDKPQPEETEPQDPGTGGTSGTGQQPE